ncbi:hypothetical protein D047_0296A, partial [Vibrio parahaemolyticus VPTS-2010_2]
MYWIFATSAIFPTH